MKRHVISLASAAICSVVIMGACKTNEANYKAAYETVVAHQRDLKGDIDTPELQATGTATPRLTEVSNSVTLPLATEWLGSPEKEPDVTTLSNYKRYNVTVARFRQLFNARQMLRRLRDADYPGASLLRSKDAYYVATYSTNLPDSALIELNRVKADTALVLKSPFPYVLRPGHLAR